MRPVTRGSAPQSYARYEDAKQDLVNRLGMYCSYCERRIPTLLAVEHIQPKALPQYAHLETVWDNFLLGCVNCNSAKSKKPVELTDYLLPDRDNTFVAYQYDDLGVVKPAEGLSAEVAAMAEAMIVLTALNPRYPSEYRPEEGALLFSALQRAGQREEAWTLAKMFVDAYSAGQVPPHLVALTAASCGFFSIWMAAFEPYPEVRRELLAVFPGTATNCFDADARPISPRPDTGLEHGSKI